MQYYHIPTATIHDDHSAFVNKITRCGEAWKLDLTAYGFVPVVYAPLLDNQKHGEPVLEEGRYYYPAVDKEQAEIFAAAQADLTTTIQQHLDTVAQSRNYDGILSLCTYVTSTDPIFAAEGAEGVIWRDACWRKGYEVMAAVIAGTWKERTPEEVEAGFFPIPTAAELLAEMPVIGWA